MDEKKAKEDVQFIEAGVQVAEAELLEEDQADLLARKNKELESSQSQIDQL